MSDQEKIKVLAELDGWTQIKDEVLGSGGPGRTPSPYGVPPGKNYRAICKSYLTSYDAIIPLVKKRCAGNALLEQTFINEVERSICSGFHAVRTVGFFPMAAEPEQLADALIKAVGKWGE